MLKEIVIIGSDDLETKGIQLKETGKVKVIDSIFGNEIKMIYPE